VAVAVVGACFLLNAVLALLLTSFVWSRRRGGAGAALAAVLVSTALWSAAYAGELLTTGAASLRWGDLKYVGIGALVPSFVAFVLCWTGRGRLVTPRTLAALAIEPVAVLVLLAVPATHDLVRSLDPASEPGVPAVALSGPLFWVHLVYTNVLLVGSVVVFVASLLRRSRHYQGEAWALVGAALLPFVVNLGFNLGLGPLAAVDLTPIAFTVSAAVLARALLERRLLRLAPIAFGAVVRGMTEGVLVLDDECRVVEANPAALALLGWGGRWGGRGSPVRTARSTWRSRSATCRTPAGTAAAGCWWCAT
jgi:PAS domain-containing protein